MAYKKSEGTRARILEAAGRLFAERGYYDATLGDIAREAGVGRASVYYYFEDKEKVARALFDAIVERIYAQTESLVGPDGDPLLEMLVKYILMFRHIALNKATQAVYYDLVEYADYDRANLERLERTVFHKAAPLAARYGAKLGRTRLWALILSSDAMSKALFKGILNGTLDFSLEEATDYFLRRVLLPEVPVPEGEYRRTLKKAFKLCEKAALA